MNYLEVNANEHNEFLINVTLTLFEKTITCLAKIDTGCDRTIIPIYLLGLSKKQRLQMFDDEKNGRNIYLTTSYSDLGKNEFNKYEYAFVNTSFEYDNVDIALNDILLKNQTVLINFGVEKPILIGVDLLKQLDIHISTLNDRTILVACLKDNISQEYINRLNEIISYNCKK